MARLNVGYTRISTDKQQLSIEAQEVKIRQQAALKDIVIDQVIADSDASAKSLDRPGMVTLLKMIDAGEVGMVICAKLDRVTRSITDLGELLKRFEKNRVTLISVSESLDTGSASGRLVLNIMTSVSSWEREAIGERTTAALQHLKQGGFPAGTPPYGWTAQPRTDEERRLKIRKPLLPNEREQEILAVIRCQRENGLSFKEIARHLNREGYRTRPSKKFPTGGEWVIQSVQRTFEEAKQ